MDFPKIDTLISRNSLYYNELRFKNPTLGYIFLSYIATLYIASSSYISHHPSVYFSYCLAYNKHLTFYSLPFILSSMVILDHTSLRFKDYKMRKIEQATIQTIRNINAYKGSGSINLSTRDRIEYETTNSGAVVISVLLHGHLIASLVPSNNSALFFSAHHQTNTTKSRLNCIMLAFTQSRLYQKEYAWYIASLDGTTVPFTDGMMIQTLVNEF